VVSALINPFSKHPEMKIIKVKNTGAWPVILLLLLIVSACGNNENGQDRTTRAVPVVTARAEIRDLSNVRTVSAPVVAYKRIYITSRTAGQVLEVPFEEGDRVRQGDLLARLDTRRQQAQLRNARVAMAEARRNYERSKQLFDEEVISPADYELAQTTLEQAESDLEFWTVEVDLGEIRAPVSGVVSAKLVEVGTTVATNERLFTLEDHNLLVVRPGLSEMDVAALDVGQTLRMFFDVYGDEEFSGRIRRIFPAADPLTRLFTVEIEIERNTGDHIIRPGYLARVRYTLDARPDVVAIPPEAVQVKDGDTLVFVVEDEKVRKTRIRTGVQRDGWVEVTSGLEAGALVAAGNLDALEDGSPVRVTGTFRRYGFRE
jgi:membrane fusion protein, multidrug efflux system